eukprot:TRINITY_DN14589_c0_g2_i2.p1 TRINITY_DN14589_c0_g2~~TRINITY_DN14589_c0_g2_i2.p1  ORF type:complete len:557 (+),score=105.39 TRINITY_DN14589_c0_g2_i2:139-1809(+)
MKVVRVAAACALAFGQAAAEPECPRGATCPVASDLHEAGEALLQRSTKKHAQSQPAEEPPASMAPPSVLEEDANLTANISATCMPKVYSEWTPIAGGAGVGAGGCLTSGSVVSQRPARDVSYQVSKLGETVSIGLADGNAHSSALAKFALKVGADNKISLGDASNGGQLFGDIYGSVAAGDVLRVEYSPESMMVKWVHFVSATGTSTELHSQVYIGSVYAYGTSDGSTGELCRLRYTGCRDLATESGRRAHCSISGDPHIKTFDMNSHWHPMHAPGHWWLVRTELDVFSIQGRYEACGWKAGGWQSARLHGVPRTCLTGLAFGGRLLNGNKFVLLPPCQWDWDNSRCSNSDRATRMYWNDQPVNDANQPPSSILSVQWAHGRWEITLPGNTVVHAWPGWGPTGVSAMFTANIHMSQNALNFKQCGHCGNFDGNSADDAAMYEMSGLLKEQSVPALCDAAVHCRDRLIPESHIQFAENVNQCAENPVGEKFGLQDCPLEILEEARRKCAEQFGHEHITENANGELNELLKDCFMDECLWPGFAKEEADEAWHIIGDA